MKRLTFRVPAMYADHHVLRVRAALAALGGVAEVLASAAQKKVTVAFEDGAVTTEQVERALAEAGYASEARPSPAAPPNPSQDGSGWYSVIHRVTKTEMKDLEMSGDFRRY
jgi:copper chaperone CopZ